MTLPAKVQPTIEDRLDDHDARLKSIGDAIFLIAGSVQSMGQERDASNRLGEALLQQFEHLTAEVKRELAEADSCFRAGLLGDSLRHLRAARRLMGDTTP